MTTQTANTPEFPRTEVEGISLPRMLMGTNWFMGFCHQTGAKSKFVNEYQNSKRVADTLIDRRERKIHNMDVYCRMIRERGMIPGLSTHTPEAIIYADETDLDVATYIQIYNAAGFLMQVEIDWIHHVIHNARKPVIVIKPMAAGRLQPLVGMSFVWATIREQDMVCVGTMTPDEARELIELSLSQLDRRPSASQLQRTRSKDSITEK